MRNFGPLYSTIVRLATPRTVASKKCTLPPKSDWDSHNIETPSVSFRLPVALRSIKSIGLKQLSQPLHKIEKYVKPPEGHLSDGTKKPPLVSRSALKYKVTQKIRTLAKPRPDIPDADTRRQPYRVLRRALRKPRPKRLAHLTQLAEPRQGLPIKLRSK